MPPMIIKNQAHFIKGLHKKTLLSFGNSISRRKEGLIPF